jgi:hypothetical protein
MNIFILHPQVSHVQFPLSLLSLCISGNADHRRSHSFFSFASRWRHTITSPCGTQALATQTHEATVFSVHILWRLRSPDIPKLRSTLVVIICEIWRCQKYTQYPMAQSLSYFVKGSGTQNGPKFGWRGVVSCQCQGKKVPERHTGFSPKRELRNCVPAQKYPSQGPYPVQLNLHH